MALTSRWYNLWCHEATETQRISVLSTSFAVIIFGFENFKRMLMTLMIYIRVRRTPCAKWDWLECVTRVWVWVEHQFSVGDTHYTFYTHIITCYWQKIVGKILLIRWWAYFWIWTFRRMTFAHVSTCKWFLFRLILLINTLPRSSCVHPLFKIITNSSIRVLSDYACAEMCSGCVDSVFTLIRHALAPCYTLHST